MPTQRAGHTPTEGQLLTVSIAGVTDADNVGATNPTGDHRSVVLHLAGRARSRPGVFEDIIVLPAGDLAFQSANGTTFRVTPDLAGLSLRVKAIYRGRAWRDGDGVLGADRAGHRRRRCAADAGRAAVTEITAAARASTSSASDLDSSSTRSRSPRRMPPAQDLLSLVPNCALPFGLRTVDGSFNNLVNFGGIDQTEFGAADNVFPRLTDPVFRNDARTALDPDGPGRSGGTARPTSRPAATCSTRSRAPSAT